MERGYRRSRRLTGIVLILLLIGLVFALWYLRLRPRPEIVVRCVTPAAGESLLAAGEKAEATPFLVEGQVIVMGPRSSVDEVVQVVRDQGIPLSDKPATDCDLGYVGALPRAGKLQSPAFPFAAEARRELVLRLYTLEPAPGQPSPTVGEAVRASDRAGQGKSVFADPNYLIGLLAQSPCGEPYEPGASPYEPGASPYEPGASPYGAVPLAETEAADLFWGQWAFEHVGVGPSLHDVWEDTSPLATGAGVRVGIFDTSPFEPPPGAEGQPDDVPVQTSQSVPWTDAELNAGTLTLQVLHRPVPPVAPLDPTVHADVRDHGLFVAGLVHAAAPGSEIQLIRVLNEYGCGDLFGLNRALFEFIAQMETDRQTLKGAVINLSLGVHQPDAADPVDEKTRLQPDVIGAAISLEELSHLIDDRIETLQAVVYVATSRGAVVVAAAGNDSYLESAPLPMQLPAAYPFVIGVAASNDLRGRACFSNWGDVSAPGGDGGPNEEYSLACAPQQNLCQGDCRQAVISLAHGADSGYAYWSGTSFSTPLVSGLAALVMESGASSLAWISPNEVFNAIRCGAPTPDGVINMPATLSRCV